MKTTQKTSYYSENCKRNELRKLKDEVKKTSLLGPGSCSRFVLIDLPLAMI